MRQNSCRLWAFVLSLTLLFSVFGVFAGIPAAAAQDTSSRFIFSALTDDEESYYNATGTDELFLPLSGKEESFTAVDLTPLGKGGSTNTLCVSLINRSSATMLRVSYQYGEHQSLTETVEQTLLTDSDEVQTFYLKAPHITEATALTVSLHAQGTLNGSVSLSSFCDISLYTAQESNGSGSEPWTTELSCQYDTVTNSIRISGQLNHVALARYGGELLALFALDPTEEIYLSNKTPVARIDLSSSFSFTVAASSAKTLFSRYVVAAVTARGERVPLSSPLYPAISISQIKGDTDFKGFHTHSVTDTLNAGAGFEIVDVYLDRLSGNQSTGILYVGDESYYYFDENYVSELDDRICRLAGAGCAVYLRFLVSPDATGLPYLAFTAVDDSVINKGIIIEDNEALNSVYALTDFLTARYASGSIGKISGIILGRKADYAAVYNHVGAMSLATYSELYASLLHLVAGTARRNIGSVDIVVPISDRAFDGRLSEADLKGNYYPQLFLQSLLRALKNAAQSPPAFSLLVESETLPRSMQAEEAACYGVDGLSQFQTLLRQSVAQYPFLSGTVLYSWMPTASLTAEETIAAYVWQYVKLYFNGQVKAFVVDLAMMSEEEAKGIVNILSYIVQRIDTNESESVTKPSLSLLGVSDLTDIAPNYISAAITDRKLLQKTLSTNGYNHDVNIRGTYTYWGFQTATSVLGWYSGALCRELSVLSDANGRALTADCLAGATGEYAEFASHFPNGRDLSFAPYVKLKLGVRGAAAASYEVQVRLVGKGVSVIASTVMKAGEMSDLYLDLSDQVGDLSSINAIRILSRPLDGSSAPYTVTLSHVTLESTILTDSQLAEKMASTVGSPDGSTDAGNKTDYAFAAIVTLIVIFTSLALVTVFIVRQKRKNAASREKRADKGEKG